MNNQSAKNKIAWEYRAYEFWTRNYGTPTELAQKIRRDPESQLKKHHKFFKNIEGKKIANLCGSNGRKAVPLALLGAKVTVFDISEENKRYALELAENAGTSINFVVTDILELDLSQFTNHFDLLYLEGGILHYFTDLNRLMTLLLAILKPNGNMVLSDFHPLKRCLVQLPGQSDYRVAPVYFDQPLLNGDVAYKQFFGVKEQEEFPDVSVKSHTMSEIINAVIQSGFRLEKFDEHPGWKGENIPWEFTIIAGK
ncbi:class I SAM-dependent methyltransferase [Bacillus salacetis]|uniref:class I SAM-dependent methyltransferase n=1 Tax=Bacillus salacetis TaxID=2315464 RepID=UPI003B9F6900